MSLKEELIKSRKLDPRFRAALVKLPDDTDEERPLFSATVEFNGASAPQIPGIPLTPIGGKHCGTHRLSLKNLKTLVDTKGVSHIYRVLNNFTT